MIENNELEQGEGFPAMTTKPAGHWQIDKRVPLALIVVLLGQTAGVGIWIGTLQTRIANLEERTVAILSTQSANASDRLETAQRLSTLEANTANIKESVSRIEDKIDGLRSIR